MTEYPSAQVPEGIDPFDEKAGCRAALDCLNAVGQLVELAEHQRRNSVVTEAAILRCLYDLDSAVDNSGNYHPCSSVTAAGTAPAKAAALAERVRARWMKAVIEWKRRPDAPSDGWFSLWNAYRQHFGRSVGPTWVDAQSRIDKCDADEEGLLNSATIYIPQEALEHQWHFGAWPFVCQRLAEFSSVDLMVLVRELVKLRDDANPASPADTIAFLESVRDAVHYAAEAKRQQLARGYSNDTLARMVRGLKWAEAVQRISTASELPAEEIGQVTRVLRRELTVGTVEQIDELLTLAMRKLRDAWERSQNANSSANTNEIVVEVPPEVIQLQRWLAVDGIKGHWGHHIASAEYWSLKIDARHRNIAFLLQQLMGGDPDESAVRNYLFRVHGILPSDEANLAKLEQLLRQDAERVRGARQVERSATTDVRSKRGKAEASQVVPAEAMAGDTSMPTKTKRSTERGEGRAKLISALTKHHQYADGGCLNRAPIGNNELARLAGVDRATASAFFKQQFQGHGKYKAICGDATGLTAALKLLNGEFAPYLLYGSKPAAEDGRGDG